MTLARHLSPARLLLLAWLLGAVFYFLDYVVRTSPAVMLHPLATQFGITPLQAGSLLGSYFITYSLCSLVAGLSIDHLGPRPSLVAGCVILALGCLCFLASSQTGGYVGRLLQGAGCAFAWPGCVFIATQGFSPHRLATILGITQASGNLGGYLGQYGIGHALAAGLGITQYWGTLAVLILLLAGGFLLLLRPQQQPTPHTAAATDTLTLLQPFRIILSNRQSWLAGVIGGLMTVPTSVFAMTWAVDLFQSDRQFSYADAVLVSSMVSLGWIAGSPLFGLWSDRLGQRKPVLCTGAVLMLLVMMQLFLFPDLLPGEISMLLLGVVSGAELLVVSISKEVNPDRVKGSAAGCANFLVFGCATLVGMLYNLFLAYSNSRPGTLLQHFQQSGLFFIGCTVLAILLILGLQETGPGRMGKPGRPAA
ncbi:MFS transporter [Aquitalea sp. ASV15]|uniref:MFS transporter n=1 Tax=Aquitalea sp. ASV15 TaxID=2795104 RepID=UPI0018EAF087|nr:MFS transporter [Aquitalea sp. ASV15]